MTRPQGFENSCLIDVLRTSEIRRIPSNPDYLITDNGMIISLKRRVPKILKERWTINRRRTYLVDGKCISAARLIALAFHPDEHFPGAEADHINNCPQDDFAWNIQWLSKTDNCRKHHGHPIGMSWTVMSPAREEYIVKTPTTFAKAHGINPRAFGEMLNEKMIQSGARRYKRKSVSGWRVVGLLKPDNEAK